MYARAVLKFDLSSIPSDAQITSAQLSLNFIFGRNVDEVCSLFVITKDWNEKEITWLNAKSDSPWSNKLLAAFPDTLRNEDDTFVQPLVIDSIIEGGGDFTQTNRSMAKTVSGETWEEYNVRDAIEAIIKNSQPNYGFLLQAQVDNKGRSYTSSNADSLNKRPKLTITYTESTGTRQLQHLMNNCKANQPLHVERIKNSLHIDVSANGCYSLTIDNISGQRLYEKSSTHPQSFIVPVSAYSNGLYIITVNEAKGRSLLRYFFTN